MTLEYSDFSYQFFVMNMSCSGLLDTDVNVWVEHWRAQLDAVGMTVIEASAQSAPTASVTTEPADFLKVCAASGQRLVFLERYESDLQRWIDEKISDDREDDEELPLFLAAFRQEYGEVIRQAEQQCAPHFYAELFLWHQGGKVRTAVLSAKKNALDSALDSFCESMDARRQEVLNLAAQEADRYLASIEEDLKSDPEFFSLRGKRKRCVYVNKKYGDRIPESRFLRRPDQYSELMNAAIVQLVERVTDAIEIAPSALITKQS